MERKARFDDSRSGSLPSPLHHLSFPTGMAGKVKGPTMQNDIRRHYQGNPEVLQSRGIPVVPNDRNSDLTPSPRAEMDSLGLSVRHDRPLRLSELAARWRFAFGTDGNEASLGRGLVYRRLRRSLATGRRDTYSGFLPSAKTGRMIAYESLLERNAAYVLEGAREVTDYLEQPEREEWDDAGKVRTYTADFGALTAFGIAYVEVKPKCFALAPETKAKHRTIKSALAARGIGHVVWTERTIARPSRAIALLLSAARRANRGPRP